MIISYKKLSQESPKKITFNYVGKTVSPIRSKEKTFDVGAIPFNAKIPYKTELTLYKQETSLQWDNLKAETKDAYISLICKKKSENMYSLEVSLDPSKKTIGNFFSEIKIHFINRGIDTQYQYVMPLTGRITSDINITPKTVYLGCMDLNKTKKGEIKLSSDVRNIELSSISSDNSNFVSIKSYEQVKGFLMLNYEAIGRKPGDQSCSILVTIGGNPKQKIAIPVIAYVKPNL